MKAKQNITNQQPNLSPCRHRIFFRPFPAGNCHRDKLMRQNRIGAAAGSEGPFSNDVSNIVDFVPLCAELDLSYFLCLWVITQPFPSRTSFVNGPLRKSASNVGTFSRDTTAASVLLSFRSDRGSFSHLKKAAKKHQGECQVPRFIKDTT